MTREGLGEFETVMQTRDEVDEGINGNKNSTQSHLHGEGLPPFLLGKSSEKKFMCSRDGVKMQHDVVSS